MEWKWFSRICEGEHQVCTIRHPVACIIGDITSGIHDRTHPDTQQQVLQLCHRINRPCSGYAVVRRLAAFSGHWFSTVSSTIPSCATASRSRTVRIRAFFCLAVEISVRLPGLVASGITERQTRWQFELVKRCSGRPWCAEDQTLASIPTYSRP